MVRIETLARNGESRQRTVIPATYRHRASVLLYPMGAIVNRQ